MRSVIRRKRPLLPQVVNILNLIVVAERSSKREQVVDPARERVSDHPTETAPVPALRFERKRQVVRPAPVRPQNLDLRLVAAKRGPWPAQSLRDIGSSQQLRWDVIHVD